MTTPVESSGPSVDFGSYFRSVAIIERKGANNAATQIVMRGLYGVENSGIRMDC